MTNFYVTYSFSDENTRRKFYEEVKAEKIGEKTRLEDGCIRYAFFFDADREALTLVQRLKCITL